MSAYNIEYFLSDFADRTLKNLQFIEMNTKTRTEVYEVTQLINSLLGLIVLPVEVCKKTEKGTPKDIDQKLSENSPDAYANIQKLLEDCKIHNKYFSNYS